MVCFPFTAEEPTYRRRRVFVAGETFKFFFSIFFFVSCFFHFHLDVPSCLFGKEVVHRCNNGWCMEAGSNSHSTVEISHMLHRFSWRAGRERLTYFRGLFCCMCVGRWMVFVDTTKTHSFGQDRETGDRNPAGVLQPQWHEGRGG